MILAISLIDKKTKINILAIHFLLLVTSAAFAQSYGQQLEAHFALTDQIITNLRHQLEIAIRICFLMGGLSLLTILFFVFEAKVFVFVFNVLDWLYRKKIWFKNKWPF